MVKRPPQARVIGAVGRDRAALLRSTALQACVLVVVSLPAAAQLAPNAHPVGGQVVAGSAQISQSAANTQIDQSSARAAIDWRGFDVGSQHSVTFAQPGPNAVILNRVTNGAASQIAGRISANGQVVLMNQSGVLFLPGSVVNAQSIVVSAASMTDRALKSAVVNPSSKLVFDVPANPGAVISNAGTITVKQAGLAALVAPQVANTGQINAKLGRVVLAGAETATLDLYGDGLLSIDVTKQVTQASLGGKTVTALVTNTGTIAADGGTIVLTAAAADSVVQTLVTAGGHIRADSIGARTGTIAVRGTGGSVIVEGTVQARGEAANTHGGQIEITSDHDVTLAGAARVNASGAAGGGLVAVGTTLARAAGSGGFAAGTAARTIVAAGARVSADATHHGNGGRVTVLSTHDTQMAGKLSARGGAKSGDGGTIEISGGSGFSLTGRADVSAPHGALGSIVLDPTNLTIVANDGASTITPGGTSPNIPYDAAGANATVREADIEGLNGNITLQATNNLTVNAPLTLGDRALTLDAGNTLTVNAGSTIEAVGLISLNAAAGGFTTTGSIQILGTVHSDRTGVTLNAGSGGITVGGVVQTAGTLTVGTTGALTESGGGQIIAGDMEGIAGSVNLPSRNNQIGSVGTTGVFTTTSAKGDFALVDSVALSVGTASPPTAAFVPTGISVANGRTISLVTNSLTLHPTFTVDDFGQRTYQGSVLSAVGGTIAVAPYTLGRAMELTDSQTKTAGSLALTTIELGGMSADTLQLGLDPALGITAGAVSIGRPVGETGALVDLGANGGFNTLSINASGAVTQTLELAVNQVTAQASSVTLDNVANFVKTLGPVTTTTGDIAFHSDSFTVGGALSANAGKGNVTLSSANGVAGDTTMTLAANITGNIVSLNTLNSDNGPASAAGIVTQTGGIIAANTLTGAAYAANLGSQNQIGTLSNFTTNQGLTLTNAKALVLGGAVVSEAGTITLKAPGITQAAGSTIAAVELDGASTGSVLLTNAGNRVGAIGSFAVTGGSFYLADSSNLSVSGTLNGDNVGLYFAPQSGLTVGAGALIRSGDGTTGDVSIEADSLTMLTATGSAGTIAGRTVEIAPSTEGRDISLTAGTAGLFLDPADFANIHATGTLVIGEYTDSTGQGIATAGNIDFSRTVDLTGTGTTSLKLDAGRTLTIDDTTVQFLNLAGSTGISINGTVTAGLITLDTFSGGVTETATGVILGGATINSGATAYPTGTGAFITLGGDVTLNNAGNQIASITGFNVTGGNFAVVDSTNLSMSNTTISGNLTATLSGGSGLTIAATTAQNVTLSAGTGGIAITGALTAAGTVDLSATAGGVTESGAGAILGAGELTSSKGVTGTVTLDNATNVISSVHAFAVTGGDFSLVDNNDLETFGTLSADNVLVKLTGGSGLTVGDGAVIKSGDGTTGRVSIAAAGFTTLTFSGSSGTISGGTVEIAPTTAGTDISTSSDTVGMFFDPANFANIHAATLLRIGAYTDTSSGATAPATTARDINFSEALDLTGTGTTSLELDAARTLTLADLTVQTAILKGGTGGIALTGTLNAGRVDLTATGGGVAESGNGVITGNSALTSSGGVVGGVSLDNVGNQIASIGGFNVRVGSFSLVNSTNLAVSNTLSADNVLLKLAGGRGLTIGPNGLVESGNGTTGTVSIAADSFTMSGAAAISGGTVEIAPATANTDMSSTTGAGGMFFDPADFARIHAATLLRLGAYTDTSTGATTPTVTARDVNFAAAIDLTGLAPGLELDAGRALNIAAITVQNLTLNGGTGGISITGALTNAGSLDLNATGGGVTESGNGVVLGNATLSSSKGVTGTVTLDNASNKIAALAGFVVRNGNFSLVDSTNLTVSNSLLANNVLLKLTSGNGLTLDQNSVIESGGGVNGFVSIAADSFTEAPALSGSAGLIGGGTVEIAPATAGTDISLTAGAAGLFIDPSDFANIHAATLLRLGAYTDTTTGATTPTTTARDITFATAVDLTALTPRLELDAGRALSVTAITVPNLTLNGGTGGIAIIGALNVTNIDLNATGGGITESGNGAIIGGATLTSSRGVTGTVTLDNATNVIGTVNGIAVTGGDFSLVDNSNLQIFGTLGADNVLLKLTSGHGFTLGADSRVQSGDGTTGLVSIAADGFTTPAFSGSSGAIFGGTVEIAPTTAGTDITMTAGAAGMFFDPANFANIHAATLLRIGAYTDGSSGATAPATTARDIDFSAATDLTGTGTTSLELDAGRTITIADMTVPNLTLNAGTGGISITGSVTATNIDLNTTGGGVAETVNGVILGNATLTSGRGITGTVNLDNHPNQIASIGGFAITGGDLSLETVSPTLLFGAGTVSVGAGHFMDFFADRVGLVAAPAVAVAIQAPGGLVTFAPRSANRPVELIGGSAADPNALSINQAFINAIDAGTLELGVLTTSGTIKIGNSGDTIGLRGHANELDLFNNGGAVTEGDGAVLDVATLSGETGSVTLAGANTIDTLGFYTIAAAAGTFTLDTATTLTIAGPVSIGGTATIASALGLTVAGDMTASSLVLQANGGNLVQSGGTITQTGTQAGQDLEVDAAGAVTQNGGAIVAQALTGHATSASLVSTTNSIAGLRSYTTSGDFTLNNAATLAVTGPVSAGGGAAITATGLTVGGDITAASLVLHASGGDLVQTAGTIRQTGTGAGQDLELDASGAVTQTAGTIIAATGLTGAATSSVSLLSAANSIPTLFGYSTSGSFAMNTNTALTVSGAVQAGIPTSAAATTLTLSAAGDLNVLAGGALTGHTINLTAGTANAQGNIILAGNVTAYAASIPSTVTVTVPGSIALTAHGAGSAGAGTITQTAGTIDTGTGGTLSVAADGDVAQTGGVIKAGTLTGGAASGSFGTALAPIANIIGNVGPFTASSGGFSLTQAAGQTLNIAGLVGVANGQTIAIDTDLITASANGAFSAPGGVVAFAPMSQGREVEVIAGGTPDAGTLSIPDTLLSRSTAATLQIGSTTTTSNIVIGQAGDAVDLRAGFGTLDLQTSGNVTEGAASLSVGTITGSAASVTLAGANTIDTIGNFSANAGFTLTDASALVIAGSLQSAGTVALNITGGSLTESGAGRITALALAGTATSMALTNANNIGEIGNFTAIGDFALTDTGNLALIGTLNAGAGTVALNTPGGTLTEDGGGLIIAGTFTGDAASATLNGANRITNLGNITATGGFSLTNSQDLAITGSLNGGTSNVSLSINGALTEPGGAITAGTLAGSAASANLGGANTVATIDSFTAPGGFTLNDTGSLALTGTLDGGTGTVTLNTPNGTLGEVGDGRVIAGTFAADPISATLNGANVIGALGDVASLGGFALTNTQDLTITGLLDAGTSAVSLNLNGALTEQGGAINAGTLTVSTTATTLNGANVISTLGNITSSGGFSLTNGQDVTITGLLDAGNSTVSLSINGAMTENGGGAINAGTLTGSATTASLGGGNTIGTLGTFTASTGSFTLADDTALVIAGPLTASGASITAQGQLTLAGNLALGDGTSNTLQVTAPADGGGGVFAQTGTSTVSGSNTVTVGLPSSGGTVNFGAYSAPSGNLTLNLGAGRASGAIAVAGLLVQGQAGAATLQGSVGTTTGHDAASIARIAPAIDSNYTLNGCVIAVASCGVAPPIPFTVPGNTNGSVLGGLFLQLPGLAAPTATLAQLRVLFIPIVPLPLPGQLTDPDVVPPNVSYLDY